MTSSAPLSKLIVSRDNVRRTNPLVDIDVLAALIKSQGLLQNLVVRKAEGGKYQIVDGKRRHAAIRMLVRSGDWPKDKAIPIKVLTADHDDTEVSLAANIGRPDMHPADTFAAFRKLSEREGAGPETIAARFGYAVSTVKGFLKLANASPKLMRAFRKDEIMLAQMQALAITDDHERQEAAFFDQPDYFRSPEALRKTIMAGRQKASDRSVRFVGLEAYEAAGGAVTRDLFGDDDEIYVEDSALVQKLLVERLEVEAQHLRDAGWKWVEIHPEFTQSLVMNHGRVSKAAHGFDPDGKAARLYAGAMLGVDRQGKLAIVQGLLKPEDAKALAKARQSAPTGTNGSGRAAVAAFDDRQTGVANGHAEVADGPDCEKDAMSASASGSVTLSAPLIEELSAAKTAALRVEVAANPSIALALVVHDLTLALFYEPWDSDHAMTGLLSHVRDGMDLVMADETAIAVKALNEAFARWKTLLPERAFGLWPWVLAQDAKVRGELLALCLAHSVNALHHRHEKREPRRVRSGGRLASTLALDMTRHWQPGEAFLARMSKSSLLAAITEATSLSTARALDKGSKADIVGAASRKLANWLPASLRTLVIDEIDDAGGSAELSDYRPVHEAEPISEAPAALQAHDG